MSEVIDIATAITTAINAGTYARPVVAERLYFDEIELDDPPGVNVSVISDGMEATRSTLDSLYEESCEAEVTVSAKLTAGDTTEMDVLIGIVRLIRTNIAMAIAGVVAYSVGFSQDELYDRDAIRTERRFHSVLTCNFKAMEAA